MQDLAGVAHIAVDLSVFPEPDDTGAVLYALWPHGSLPHAGEDLLPLGEVKNIAHDDIDPSVLSISMVSSCKM